MGGFGEASMQKLVEPIFRQVSQIQSKSLESIVAGRKNMNHCIFLGAPLCFPKVRTIRSMLAVNATREFGEVGTC